MESIQLDKHIENIMPLECVRAIEKLADGNYLFRLIGINTNYGDEGDWLVNVNNKWWLQTKWEKEYGFEPWKSRGVSC